MANQARKITVELPQDLLDKAMEQTNEGLTETIRQGLVLLAQSSSYKALKELKGKAKFKYSWKKLKEDS